TRTALGDVRNRQAAWILPNGVPSRTQQSTQVPIGVNPLPPLAGEICAPCSAVLAVPMGDARGRSALPFDHAAFRAFSPVPSPTPAPAAADARGAGGRDIAFGIAHLSAVRHRGRVAAAGGFDAGDQPVAG